MSDQNPPTDPNPQVPTFVAPPSTPSAAGFAGFSGSIDPPPTSPPTPGLPPTSPPPPDDGNLSAGANSKPPAGEQRPLPNLLSQLGAGGGVLIALGLFFITLDEGANRGGTIFISSIFALGGVALMLWNRDHKAITAGVALSGLATIPLIGAVVNLSGSAEAFLSTLTSSGSELRNKQMSMLALLAIIWLLCYVLSPARRHAFFLGAALFAIWLIPMTFFSTSATTETLGSLSSSLDFSTATPISPSEFDESASIDDFNDLDDLDDLDSTGGFDTSGLFDSLGSQTQPIRDLPRKLGFTSIAFGAAYLALAGMLDSRGDKRAATAGFAAAIVILWQGLAHLGGDMSATTVGILGIIIAVAGLALGVQGERRFTAWSSVALGVTSMVSIVGDHMDDPIKMGYTLAFIGASVAFAASLMNREQPRPMASSTWTPPPGAAPTPDSSTPGGSPPSQPPSQPQWPTAPAENPWAPPTTGTSGDDSLPE